MSELVVRQTNKYVNQQAKKLGVNAVFPRADELFIDLDEGMQLNAVTLEVMNDHNYITNELHTVSRNGNQHVYYRLIKSFSVSDRIALQAALGSDPQKELLSALDSACECPVVLFETDKEFGNVLVWRERIAQAEQVESEVPSEDEDIFK